jgi:glycosyltransferase involved in cell wall biosynthesis
MPSPLVSVALATYNGARFLPEQLASIAGQDRRPDELVVGDDQSTDATAAIVDRFGRDSGIPVRFTRNPQRLGSSANFAAILARCQGDIILLSDQDDVWRGDRISTSLRHLTDHPRIGFVFSNARLMSEAGVALPGRLWDRVFFGRRQQRAFAHGRGAEVLLRANTVTGATMALRRSALEAALPIPAGWLHDAWLALIIERTHGARPIDDVLIDYRLHAGQQMSVAGWSVASVRALLRRQDAGHFRSEARNFRALAERLQALGPAHEAVAEQARRKAEFLDLRAAGRESLGGCLAGVAGGLARGRYHRLGLGLKQAAFDLAGGVEAALRR